MVLRLIERSVARLVHALQPDGLDRSTLTRNAGPSPKITELDDAGLRSGCEWAIAQPWVDERTKSLFRQGMEKLK